MIKKILVPMDGSKLAECVLPYVEELATKLDAKVALISVTNRVQGYWPYEEPGIPDKIRMIPQGVCSQEEHATNYLNAVAKGLEEKGIKVTKEVICGKTAQEIVYYGKDTPCDLIIMSTHGRSGLSRMAHGSITEKVLKLTSKPVMVVRPQH